MVTKVVPGLLIATPDKEEAAREACARMLRAIDEALKQRGEATIALSGGSSPLDAYALLAKAPIDWKKIQIYWVDERCVPPDDDRSNYFHAKTAFLDKIAIPPENVHRMVGEAADPAAFAAEYEQLLRDTVKSKVSGLPALDLVILGIGDDGHTASLFPHHPEVDVTDKLVVAVPMSPTKPNVARLTLTPPMLENAKASVIIVLGKTKHEPLERIWSTAGNVQDTPSRIIRGFRGSITWVIDRAAGGMG